jgi:predicted nucleotide-binding protein
MKKQKQSRSARVTAPQDDPVLLLDSVKTGSTITLCARTAVKWAERYSYIQQAIIERNIRFNVLIADDNAVMGTLVDHGKYEVSGCAKKFKLIKLPANSRGEFCLYRSRIFLPLSYLSWHPASGRERVLLTAGANLSDPEKSSILLTAPDPFVTALAAVHRNILKGSRLDYRTGGKPKGEAHRKARIFISSSTRNIAIAEEVQQNLRHLADVIVWNQGVFRTPVRALDSLLEQLDRSDYGIFVFAADDITVSGGRRRQSVRDNVLFEYGLFVGRLGKKKNWLMLPSSATDTLRMASDLFGIRPLIYDDARPERRAAAIGEACYDIRVTLEAAL